MGKAVLLPRSMAQAMSGLSITSDSAGIFRLKKWHDGVVLWNAWKAQGTPDACRIDQRVGSVRLKRLTNNALTSN